MKVCIESTLWESGRLSKLARTLRVAEHDALGRLVGVWRRTQQSAVSTDSVDRIVTIIVIDFDSDDEARHFLFAMTTSGLAKQEEGHSGGLITILGNAERISLLKSWHDGRVRGGSLSAVSKKLSKSVNYSSSIAHENKEKFELEPDCLVKQKKPKRGRTEEQQARGLSINRLYRQLYIHTYKKEPTGMDARANAALARFSDTHAENAETILRTFFATSNRDGRGHGINWLTVTAQALWSQCQGGPRITSEPSWDEKMAALDRDEIEARAQDAARERING